MSRQEQGTECDFITEVPNTTTRSARRRERVPAPVDVDAPSPTRSFPHVVVPALKNRRNLKSICLERGGVPISIPAQRVESIARSNLEENDSVSADEDGSCHVPGTKTSRGRYESPSRQRRPELSNPSGSIIRDDAVIHVDNVEERSDYVEAVEKSQRVAKMIQEDHLNSKNLESDPTQREERRISARLAIKAAESKERNVMPIDVDCVNNSSLETSEQPSEATASANAPVNDFKKEEKGIHKEEDQTVFPLDREEVEEELKNLNSSEAPYNGSTSLIFEYPPGQRGKIRVTEEERERLVQRKYLNDSLIDFFIKYQEKDLQRRDERLQFSAKFFSSFFFGRLRRTKPIDYEGVKGWTKNVDLFSKKYVFVPVCDSFHWSLIIVANLDKLEEAIEKKPDRSDSKSPRIIYLDSLDPSRGVSFAETMRQYLVEEWLTRKKMCQYVIEQRKETLVSFKKALPTFRPTVPMQNNEYDCGLYLLNSLVMFLYNIDGLKDKLLAGHQDVRDAYTHVDVQMLRKRIASLMDSFERMWIIDHAPKKDMSQSSSDSSDVGNERMSLDNVVSQHVSENDQEQEQMIDSPSSEDGDIHDKDLDQDVSMVENCAVGPNGEGGDWPQNITISTDPQPREGVESDIRRGIFTRSTCRIPRDRNSEVPPLLDENATRALRQTDHIEPEAFNLEGTQDVEKGEDVFAFHGKDHSTQDIETEDLDDNHHLQYHHVIVSGFDSIVEFEDDNEAHDCNMDDAVNVEDSEVDFDEPTGRQMERSVEVNVGLLQRRSTSNYEVQNTDSRSIHESEEKHEDGNDVIQMKYVDEKSNFKEHLKQQREDVGMDAHDVDAESEGFCEKQMEGMVSNKKGKLSDSMCVTVLTAGSSYNTNNVECIDMTKMESGMEKSGVEQADISLPVEDEDEN